MDFIKSKGINVIDAQPAMKLGTKAGIYQQRSYLRFSMPMAGDFDPLKFSRKLRGMGMEVSSRAWSSIYESWSQYILWDIPELAGLSSIADIQMMESELDLTRIATTMAICDESQEPLEWIYPSVLCNDRDPPSHTFVAVMVAKDWTLQCDDVLASALA